MALFTTVERLLLDWLVFWLPLYYEAKVLFIIYLWHPKTQGAMNIYNSTVRPFLVSHEATVDQYIQESKTWMSDFLAAHFHRLTQFLQSKAHVAVAALQQVQHAKKEKEDDKKLVRSKSTKSKSSNRTPVIARKPSLEDLPSVPKTGME